MMFDVVVVPVVIVDCGRVYSFYDSRVRWDGVDDTESDNDLCILHNRINKDVLLYLHSGCTMQRRARGARAGEGAGAWGESVAGAVDGAGV